MNPFNLPGPDFLAFYVVFAAAVLAGLHLALERSVGPASPGRFKMANP